MENMVIKHRRNHKVVIRDKTEHFERKIPEVAEVLQLYT